MIQVQINSKREFTRHLFLADTFDSFLLEEATIKNANTYIIDGHVNKEYYTNEELADHPEFDREFTPWSEMKALCFDLIKGKKLRYILNLSCILTNPNYKQSLP